MTVSRWRAAATPTRVQRENETLYAVIKTVSSSLELDRVLGGIVDIATDATSCHAAFIYFVEGDRLVLRAASPSYSHLVGTLAWGVDEGLTGWVARTKTPSSSAAAMEDPRMKYVPELEEEHFQSMVAVPCWPRRRRDRCDRAPYRGAARVRRRSPQVSRAHGVARGGAIENAKLFEETRRRVGALTTLRSSASRSRRRPCARTSTRRSRAGRAGCSARTPARSGGSTPTPTSSVLAGSEPADAPRGDAAARARGAAARPHAARARRRRRAPVDGEDCSWRRSWRATSSSGSCCASPAAARFGAGDAGAAGSRGKPDRRRAREGRADRAAHGREHRQGHVRGARRRIGRYRRAEGGRGALRPQPPARVRPRRARAPAAGADGPPLAGPGRALRERGSQRLYPRAFFDARHDAVRALAPLPHRRGARGRAAAPGAARSWRATRAWCVGLSDVDRGAASARRRMREAADAARIGRSLAAGGRRRLLRAARRLPLPGAPRARRRAARPLRAGRRAS